MTKNSNWEILLLKGKMGRFYEIFLGFTEKFYSSPLVAASGKKHKRDYGHYCNIVMVTLLQEHLWTTAYVFFVFCLNL